MNTTKISNYNKLIAFFLIIVALLSILVISAKGWQTNDVPSNNLNKNETNNENSGENKLPSELPTTHPEINTPKFYHYLTGVEIDEKILGDSQVAYVIDGNSPLCGISNANLLIEFPIENGKTRYIMVADKSKDLPKVGSITYSRYFISNLAATFGATIISLGNDDAIEYDHVNTSTCQVDLQKNTGTYYTEYTYFTYTSSKLIEQSLVSSSTIQNILPYAFKDNLIAEGTLSATTINIPYEVQTSAVYSQLENKYCIYKMGSDKIDVSSSASVMFTNVLILYADSITYETADKTQMVINTIGSGCGYFAYGGAAEEIRWSMDSEGNLSLFNKNGKKLEIGRGNTYIAYVKSSKTNNLIFQ